MTNLAESVNTPALMTMDFHGDQIITFEDEGVRYVAMRRIVENLGMSWSSQRAKLVACKAKFSCAVNNTTGADGKSYEMLSIPVEKLPLWLASLNPTRIKDQDTRLRIELYQEQSARALFEFWTTGVAVRDDLAGVVDDIGPEARKVLGGIVKGIIRSELAAVRSEIASLGMSDPVTGPAVEFLTSKQVVEDFGFKRGEIRGRAGQLTTRIRKFSMEHHHPLRLTAETKRHLFHVDAVRDWMESGGRDWLTAKLIEARAKAAGQGHLQLVS